MRDIQTIKLQDLLPPSIASDPDVMAAAEALDAELQNTVGYIPYLAIIHRLRNKLITDETLIDSLATQFHVDFYDPDFPLELKQELVAKSLDWHSRKGTPSVVEEIVTAVFSDAVVSEWFDYDGLPYRFKVATEITNVSASNILTLIDAIFSVKNTRSWLEKIEIVRKYICSLYIGTGISQGITQTIGPRLADAEIDQQPWYYASFLYMHPEIVIEGGV